MPTQSIPFEGANLYVEMDGNADQSPLLLWPPGQSTLRVWDHLIPTLEKQFFVIRIDVRGYGQSSVSDLNENQFTFEQYARDAKYVLDLLGVRNTHVWSQSWGTRAAIWFCAKFPGFVNSAALYAANLDLPDVNQQREGTRAAAEERRVAGIDTGLDRVGFNEHMNPEAAQLTASALRKVLLSDVIDRLSMPVLIGTGSHDPNLRSSTEIANRLRNATLRKFEMVGHNAILEHPELALEAFLEFHQALTHSD
ncbi:MAG: alpha/beta hydrolase [Gammaproteobacteria bacterium]|nr:alpha/beta hydrolase [Gammaproteobacteria bacterium]